MEERLRSYNLLYRYSFKHMPTPETTRVCLVLQKQDKDKKTKLSGKLKDVVILSRI